LFGGFALAKWHNAARWAFAFFVAVAGSGLAGNILKLIFGKSRPERLFEAGFFGFTPFSYGHDVNSFPSGHATTFGALAMMFALLFPRFGWFFLALGACGISTRVFVQAHYVSDVCAGFSLGMLGALMVFVVWRRRWTASVPLRGRWV
jgi:undecaprenyl-diphosphatase